MFSSSAQPRISPRWSWGGGDKTTVFLVMCLFKGAFPHVCSLLFTGENCVGHGCDDVLWILRRTIHVSQLSKGRLALISRTASEQHWTQCVIWRRKEKYNKKSLLHSSLAPLLSPPLSHTCPFCVCVSLSLSLSLCLRVEEAEVVYADGRTCMYPVRSTT